MRNLNYIIFLAIILSSCAKDKEQSVTRDERALLLTGYSLQSLKDDFVFSGKLFYRNDLSPERSYVFFKAFEIKVPAESALYAEKVAVLSECGLPDKLQASLRVPGTYDVIALNTNVVRNQRLFINPIPKGTYILTLGVLSERACDSGFQVGLKLSESAPTEAPSTDVNKELSPPDPVQPNASRESPPVVTPEDRPEEPASVEPEPNLINPLLGSWEISYTATNGHNIQEVREFSNDRLEKKVFDNTIQTEHIIFSVEYSEEKDQYSATVEEVRLYKYAPEKYKVGDTYLCTYQLSNTEEKDQLRYACSLEDYPLLVPQKLTPYVRRGSPEESL